MLISLVSALAVGLVTLGFAAPIEKGKLVGFHRGSATDTNSHTTITTTFNPSHASEMKRSTPNPNKLDNQIDTMPLTKTTQRDLAKLAATTAETNGIRMVNRRNKKINDLVDGKIPGDGGKGMMHESEQGMHVTVKERDDKPRFVISAKDTMGKLDEAGGRVQMSVEKDEVVDTERMEAKSGITAMTVEKSDGGKSKETMMNKGFAHVDTIPARSATALDANATTNPASVSAAEIARDAKSARAEAETETETGTALHDDDDAAGLRERKVVKYPLYPKVS
ncbi:hypothetical protein B0J11DRAFT_617554 [Dendryphion nanum]|uniref:Uncharacterized protein n=1 Tax=Dendryphion nanum TaxID=256645 RepID=A0A9P9IFQ4_9PLEO|nr:hypothetical protein B0J11DRAFT_617554 [Dendryphion nanum]